MKLTLDHLRAVTSGVERVEEENGVFRFYRFSAAEMKTNANPNRVYAAGGVIGFRTDATALSLAFSAESLTGVRSYFVLEVYVNGARIGTVQNFDGAQMTGNYAEREYPLGDFSGAFLLGTGEKTVKLVLPHSVSLSLSELTLTDETFLSPLPERPALIAYGDSITQGYDALYPSETYAMRLADALGCTLVNKALGGATFLPALAAAENGRQEGTLLVAYGTNDWRHQSASTFRQNAQGFLDRLRQHYPSSPIFVLSPIFRADKEDVTLFGRFETVADILREICEGRDGVKFFDGMDLVPHDESYFGDLHLHPSGEGFAHYAENLRKMLSKKLSKF